MGNKHELIERYLNQKMTTEERNSFEVLLKNDDELAEEVNLNRLAKETLNNTEKISFRDLLSDISQSYMEDFKKKLPNSEHVNEEENHQK